MKGKHSKDGISKRNTGKFHSTEWALYGTSCKDLKVLVEELKTKLSDYNISYIDADHNNELINATGYNEMRIHHAHEVKAQSYDFQFYDYYADALFINGNHYPASRQIVIIDERKKESLYRRLDQLNNVKAIVVDDRSKIYDFLSDKISSETIILNHSQLITYLRAEIKDSIPPLKALILAGGKSSRMGTDKSTIKYHGVDQEIYMADMCNRLGLETYISKSPTHKDSSIDKYNVIKDRVLNMGPMGAILSAFFYDPNTAWLVLACDLPLLNESILSLLIDGRKTNFTATSIKHHAQPFPEPLISIYEPRAYKRLLNFLSIGYSCPRKMLINSHINIIDIKDHLSIKNINTPAEADEIRKHLHA